MAENLEKKKARVKKIIRLLRQTLSEKTTALSFKNPLELLIATILSAQCTDKRVNLVTPALFRKYRMAKDYAEANPETLETEIRSTGFYHAKTKSIIGCAKGLVSRFGGKIPVRMEEMVTLPGIGRKTANVVLGNAFGIPGIAVDTHVKRLSNRLGLTEEQDPEKIEFDLNRIVPKRDWTEFSHLLIWHGRFTCAARKPKCDVCAIRLYCPSREKG